MMNNVEEKTFYMKEEDEDEEVLRQLREIHQLHAPSSSTSSGASMGQNNNYKYSEGDGSALKSDVVLNSETPGVLYDAGLKVEGSPHFFQRDDSPALQAYQQQQFTNSLASNAEAQLLDSSALPNAVTSLSCKGRG